MVIMLNALKSAAIPAGWCLVTVGAIERRSCLFDPERDILKKS